MKKITLCALLLGSMYAGAQTISQSESMEVAEANTIACTAQGFATAPNSYFRYFELEDDHGITGAYTITSVEFGIETLATNTAGSHPITVSLYATTGSRSQFMDNFSDMTNITLVGEETIDVDDQELMLVTADVDGVVPAGSNLIVELSYEGDEEGNTILFLGSNDAGESGPTYIMSTGCEINDPIEIADVANGAEIHIIMSVTGTSGAAGVEDNALANLSVSPNPTTGIINIDNAGMLNNVSLTDVSGKVVAMNVVGNTVDISSFASGVYFLNIETEKGSTTKKIVKK